MVVTNKITADDGQCYEIQANALHHAEIGFSGGAYTVKGVINRGESMICHDGSWMDWADAADLAKDVATGINGHIQIHPDRGCLRGVEEDYKQACKYRGEVK